MYETTFLKHSSGSVVRSNSFSTTFASTDDVARDVRRGRTNWPFERPPDDEGPPAPGDGVVPRPRILGGLALAFLALRGGHGDALRAVASELVDVLGPVAVRHSYVTVLFPYLYSGFQGISEMMGRLRQ